MCSDITTIPKNKAVMMCTGEYCRAGSSICNTVCCCTLQSPDWYDEGQVGVGLAEAKVPREQLFLTSKIHPRDLGRNGTLAAVKRSLSHFKTTYLDLLLLHYPSCTPGTHCVPHPHKRWQDSWGALEELVAAKLVRSIGEYRW